MNKQKILERLKNDEDYYGEFGQQFLSNSNISTLLTNPLALKEPMDKSPALLVGGYFHTAILEPEKLFNFKIINTTTRNTSLYKEMSGGEMCLLQHEADKTEADWKLDMVQLFKAGKITEARKLVCASARAEEMEEIYRWLYDNIDLFGDADQQDKAIMIIKQGLVDHTLVVDPEINLAATLIKLGKV